MKYRKIVLTILIMLSLYVLISFMPATSNEVFAGQMPAGTLKNDEIDGIDDAFYPGYKQLLKNLKSAHPNYTFWLFYTGLNWNEVLVTEYQGHGGTPLNLFQVGDKYNGMWMCPLCGNKPYDNGSWCCASLEALSYMMDPRNSLNESDLFQFKRLVGSGDVSYQDIARVVANYGAYLNNPEAIQAIVDASNMYQVNGYFLVSKIVNEHGKNGSTLSNGNGYNGNYVGCYNYFNIGSYGNGTANIINHGLSYAQSHGWTSIRASILGGTQLVKEKYITKYSQDTLYLQKFNVSGRSTLGSNQYQQNIMAAQSQGTSLKSYYSNLSGEHVFIIPIYEGMPAAPSGRPNAGQANTISWENGVVQNISSSLRVRASANGTAIGALNGGESIKILQRASSPVGSYYWDLIVSNKDGTYGYAARGTSSEAYIVGNGTTGSSNGTISNNPPAVDPTPTPTPTPEPEPEPLPKPPKPEKNLETDIKIKESSVQILPDITYEDLKTKYEEVTVKNSKDEEVTSGSIGTGYKITIKDETYTIVKKGDVDGDSRITVADVRIMLNSISKQGPELKDIYKDAACVKGEENFTTGDIRYLLNCITGYAYISL